MSDLRNDPVQTLSLRAPGIRMRYSRIHRSAMRNMSHSGSITIFCVRRRDGAELSPPHPISSGPEFQLAFFVRGTEGTVRGSKRALILCATSQGITRTTLPLKSNINKVDHSTHRESENVSVMPQPGGAKLRELECRLRLRSQDSQVS